MADVKKKAKEDKLRYKLVSNHSKCPIPAPINFIICFLSHVRDAKVVGEASHLRSLLLSVNSLICNLLMIFVSFFVAAVILPTWSLLICFFKCIMSTKILIITFAQNTDETLSHLSLTHPFKY